jgi:hypothetical protein
LELVIAVAVAYLFVAGGVTWAFGAYGLVGVGAVALVALFFVNPKE